MFRGEATCPKSHSQWMAEPGFGPRFKSEGGGLGPGLLGLREEGLGGWAPGPEFKALALRHRSGLGPGGS